MSRLATSQSRRQDTREKIKLGGLIVKAGLHFEKPALLLGLLMDAGRRLHEDGGERDRLTAIGADAFDHDSE